MSRMGRPFGLLIRPPRMKEALADWLYRELRDAALSARLPPGTLLPSTRAFAREYKIARGTVVQAYAQLTAEGYLEGRVGSGTRVCATLPDQAFKPAELPPVTGKATVLGRVSARGKLMSTSLFPEPSPSQGVIAFRANCPSVLHFPAALWSRLGARRMGLASRCMLLEGQALGYRPLREAIAAHLGATRGVVCQPEQIAIVSGTQQALDLVARLTLDPGDQVWLEDPGYPGALSILRAAGAKLVPIPVDENGIRVADGIVRAPKARLAYVTPANQFPLCVTLSTPRRLQLLEWSRTTGAWIFEDDYDSEFRFNGRPPAALQGLAPEGNVIFAGSFSKMLFPALRLSYLVAPPHLVENLQHARSITDRYGATIAQAVLCDFIAEGHFGRHLRRMRQVYAEHLDVLTAAADREWGDRLIVQPVQAGLQTIGWLANRHEDIAFAAAARACGVEVTPLSPWSIRWRKRNGLQIGFAAVGPAELRRGVAAVATLLG